MERIDLSENAVVLSGSHLGSSSRIVQERTDPHRERSLHNSHGFDTKQSS